MISTTELTGAQLEQLDALLADTTPGGGIYRPPVATDNEVLRELVDAGLAYCLQGLFDHFEVTDLGKAIVVDRAMDAAAAEAFVRCATRHELREAISNLKVVFNDLTDPVLRDRTLQNIEACQDRLDDLTDGASESTGRHRLVPVDDRPTAVIPPVEPMTDQESESVAFKDSAERLLAAIKGADTCEDVYDELAAETTGEWDALEADLGDDDSRWGPPVVPGSVFVVSLLAAIVVTWVAAWLVIG